MSRNGQALVTHYNVYFNGYEAYKEGINNIYTSNVDDYSKLIPLYPISNHASADAATSQMDRAIEKAQKAVKEHSIRKKPKRNAKKAKDPAYQSFMAQEEYNPEMDEAWILLGKAQFHKAQFLEAVGTFTYIVKHFGENRDAVAEARVWMARSYIEMDWLFEAESVLDLANKEQMSSKLSGLYSTTRADLLIRQDKKKQAIPYLEVAADKETYKKQLVRTRFVLAQLYQSSGQNSKAIDYYNKVLKSNPSFEMDLSARIGRAKADNKNSEKAVKDLNKMLRSPKYAENHDKIYTTIGDIYLAQGKTDEAIKNYKLAVEKSKTGGYDKLQALVSLADLYYSQSKYLEAQPYYEEAASLISMDSPDYTRVTRLSQQLNDLNQQAQIVIQQDSLQALSKLPKEVQEARVKEQIAKLLAEEKAQKEAFEKAIAAQSGGMEDDNSGMPPMGGGMGQQGNWYFYNVSLVATGKADFQKRWGTRKLEDNWRRKNKLVISTPDGSEAVAQDGQGQQGGGSPADFQSNVNTDIQYYLKQIPVTEQQLQASDEQIATALYNQANIYKDQIEDIPMAIKTLEELNRRFPADKRTPEVLYSLHQLNKKIENADQATAYRTELIQKYPETNYAKALAQPDYAERMAKMHDVQDSLYQETYFAYLKSDYQAVFNNYKIIKENYPLSSLMPKFAFLNALSEGKAGNTEALKTDMEKIVETYPQSDVSPMAKDILALIKQGNQVQTGSSHGSMLSLRDAQNTTIVDGGDSLKFVVQNKERHFIGILAENDVDFNKLQFNIASYNFTGFLIKNFDIDIQKYNASNRLVTISSFDNLDEAVWYKNSLLSNADVSNVLSGKNYSVFAISETNYQMLRKGLPVEQYLDFYNNNILHSAQPHTIQPTQPLTAPKVEPVQPVTQQTKPATAQQPVIQPAVDTVTVKKPATKELKQTTKPAVDTTTIKKPVVDSTKTIKKPVQQPAKPATKESVADTTTTKKTATTGTKPTSKPVDTTAVTPKPAVQPKTTVKPATTKPVADTTTIKKTAVTQTQPAIKPATTPAPATPAQPMAANYKVNATAPHAYAIIVTKGKFDFDKLKSTLEAYNTSYYPLMNLKITRTPIDDEQQLITVGMMPEANTARSYMFQVLRKQELLQALRGTEYRSVLISDENQAELLRTKAVADYLNFSRTNYMK